MITLRDVIGIKASPEQIIDFFLNFEGKKYKPELDYKMGNKKGNYFGGAQYGSI